MKKLLLLLWVLLLPTIAFAQPETRICFTTNGTNCVPVTSTNPLPVTGSGGGGIPITIGAGAIAVGAALDGWNVTQGAKADAVCATATGICSEQALLKYIASAVSSAVPAGTSVIGYTSNDPCSYGNKINKPFNQNGTSSVELVALSGSTTVYVCSISLIAAGATTWAMTTGTGSACVTNNAAVIGSTTAAIANSMSFATNGGLTLGNGGSTIAKGAASSAICHINGTNVYVAGNITYVQQ